MYLSEHNMRVKQTAILVLAVTVLYCTNHCTASDLTVKIGDIQQPYNCTLFLDNLEVLLDKAVNYVDDIVRKIPIRSVQVHVPRHWDFSRCSLQDGGRGPRTTTYGKSSGDLDILIGNSNPGFKNTPWALQHRGCGRRGLYVNLPIEFIGHKDTILNSEDKGRVLAKEWLKYRFGVFSENGFYGDRMYPAEYRVGNESYISKSCRSKDDSLFCRRDDYDSSVPSKQNLLCRGESGLESILRVQDQEIEEKQQVENREQEWKNEQEKVLNYIESPSTTPGSVRPSNGSALREKPDGVNPSDLISQAEQKTKTLGRTRREETHKIPGSGSRNEFTLGADLQGSEGSNSPEFFTEPTLKYGFDSEDSFESGFPSRGYRIKFQYVLSSTTKYNILLDQSSGMAEGNRWIYVKRALFRFIDLLPVGSRLNILAFGSSVKEVLPTTRVTELNRDGLFGRIPRRVLDDVTSCVECALKGTLSSIGHNEAVILISGVQNQIPNYARVLNQVREKKIPIFIVTYPATIHPSYIPLAEFGGVYSVVENSPKLHPLTHLQEILASIISNTESETVEKLHETHYNSLAFAGTFNYDREDPTDLMITLNVPDEEKVEFFEVKDPSGKKRIFSKFEDGMVYFKFSGHLPSGIWSYHAKLYHDSVFPDTKMSVDVITRSETSSGIYVDIFTSNQTPDPTKEPVVVFSKIMRNGLPIVGAKATAELYIPGGVQDGALYTLDLHDNGLGYPDITAGDGIYSGYVPGYGMVPGFYAIRVLVTDNNGEAGQAKHQAQVESVSECCGSRIEYGNISAPTGTFQRISAGESFYLAHGYPLTEDISPPCRISDLQMAEVLNETLAIRLDWTAPGGDLDFGKAHKYEIRCHTDPSMLADSTFSEKGILVHSESVPIPGVYGTPQTSTVGVPWPNQLFYYAIVAIDDRGNRGTISNLVSVFILESSTTTTTESGSSPAPIDPLDILSYLQSHQLNSNDSLDDKHLREKFLKLSENLVELKGSNSEIYIATGIVSGVVVVIIIILIALVLLNRRKRSMSPVPIPATPNTTTTYKEPEDKSNLGQVTKLSSDGSSKVLLSWLDSLPKTDDKVGVTSSSPSSHNTSLDSTLNTISRRNHTLTKTNPYRHKVLTNGSFVSLKDIPSGSEEGSTRMTSSTLDDSNGSDTSSGSHNNVGLTSKSLKVATSSGIKRSNTSASSLRPDNPVVINTASLRRSHNTGYFSFRDYSPVYATATLGRGYRSNLPVLAEDSIHGTMRHHPNQTRRTKRTESFV